MQNKATYGLNLSPTRANFQNVPIGPVFLRSNKFGHNDRRYAQVQISNNITVNSDEKLNKADIFHFFFHTCVKFFQQKMKKD